MRPLVLASSALGEREQVYVYVYDTQAEMLAAARAFNGVNDDDSVGAVTQAWTDQNDRTTFPVIRLHRDRLGSRVLSHEVHHATTALYGAHVGDRISRRAHLNHWNESFAHLYSDMFASLVGQLRDRGWIP